MVGGFSAGAVAALNWANYIAQTAKDANVKVLADSGIFFDSINVFTQ